MGEAFGLLVVGESIGLLVVGEALGLLVVDEALGLDYTSLAKKLATSARKKAKAVNLFDGKVVFGETKVMSKIDAREATLVAELNDHCEASKRGALIVVFPETGGETRKR